MAEQGTAHDGVAPEGEPEDGATRDEELRRLQRRRFLQASIGVTVALTVTGLSALSVTGSLRPIAKVAPDQEPPADGDLLVYADPQTKMIRPEDLDSPAGGTLAYPKDPTTGLVKSGTEDNLILLARFQPARLGPDTAPHAAAGVVGYSAICTHLCCTVSDWDAKQNLFVCPCHHSYFDPRVQGKVVTGPAPRPLPLLPLKLVNGTLAAAGGFLTSIGCS